MTDRSAIAREVWQRPEYRERRRWLRKMREIPKTEAYRRAVNEGAVAYGYGLIEYEDGRPAAEGTMFLFVNPLAQ